MEFKQFREFFEKWKRALFLLVAIVLLALLARIINLTLLPVFADEAIYIRWAQIMGAEPTLRFLPLSDGKQPLYMWILMFAVRRFSDPLFIARSISVISGLVTLVGIFTSSYLLFKNKKVSLLASFFWAISPFSFFFDRMALVDSMLAMFGVWTFVFGILIVQYKRLDTAMIAGFFLGFALLTKSPAVFLVILIPSLVLISKLRKNKALSLIKLVFFMMVAYLIAFGMYNILRLGPNFHLIGARNQDYVFPLTHVLTNPLDPLKFHIEEVFSDWLVKLGPGVILFLFVIGIVGNIKKYPREIILLSGWFLVPLLIQSEYAKVFTARYILFIIPFLFIISASSILVRSRIFLKFTTAIIVIFVFWSLKEDYFLLTNPALAALPSSERSGYLEEWTAGQGIKEISDFLKSQHLKNPGQKIVVGTEGYFGTLPDGLQMYMEGTPNVTVIGIGLSIKEVPKPLAESKKAGNPTYLVINKSRLIAKDPEKVGLKLIAAYPKPERREKGSREYILNGSQEVLYLFEVGDSMIRSER